MIFYTLVELTLLGVLIGFVWNCVLKHTASNGNLKDSTQSTTSYWEESSLYLTDEYQTDSDCGCDCDCPDTDDSSDYGDCCDCCDFDSSDF